MAFGVTSKSFSTKTEVRQFLDSNGGICDAQTDQETTIFALSIKRDAIEEAVMLLTETAFQPHITEESVREALQNVENDLRYLKYEKIRDKEVIELACQAGYRKSSN
jgi:predicted Zn-dependent peptidase